MARDDAIKEQVRAVFGTNAHKYVTSESHARGSDLQLLLEWLDPQPGWTALDVATGGGHVARVLSPRVAHVVATDLTPAMLAAARDHLAAAGCGNVTFVVADAEALPFLDASCDLVTCRIAPHHFPHPERFVQEVARVLRPGGRFLLIDNISPDDPELAGFLNTVERLRDPSHVRCPSVSEWREWFRAAGLLEQRSLIWRKARVFPDWVERTATSPEQIRAVKAYIAAAPARVQAYFAVEMDGSEVRSFTGDQWMVLCTRP